MFYAMHVRVSELRSMLSTKYYTAVNWIHSNNNHFVKQYYNWNLALKSRSSKMPLNKTFLWKQTEANLNFEQKSSPHIPKESWQKSNANFPLVYVDNISLVSQFGKNFYLIVMNL